jgi:enoyl-CoA hydratase/carnithine racemase
LALEYGFDLMIEFTLPFPFQLITELQELVPQAREPDRLRARVQERATAMAALPAHAFRAAKEAIHRGIESTMEHEWAANVLAQSVLLSSSDFAACLEERAPPNHNA